MNLNRRVPNGLPGGVRGRKFYYFLLLDYIKILVSEQKNVTYEIALKYQNDSFKR